MKTIAFYISNHGFGHASRNIPIIRHVLARRQDIKIIVKTNTLQLDFMNRSLAIFSSRIEFIEMQVDVGLIPQNGSISIDIDQLRSGINDFVCSWNQLISQEIDFLISKKVQLVISDIVPWIFKSANLNGTKSIFISNFTWVEIYEELLDPFITEQYLQCYRLADEAFIYPLAGNIKQYFNSIQEVGLSCREFNADTIKSIKKKSINPLVYISLGRAVFLKEPVDVFGLPYEFIYTEGIELRGNNATKLPVDTLITHDYIGSSDYVITKATWGTVAEAICAQKPMLVLRRDEVAEDRVILAKLLELDIALPIDLTQLYAKSFVRLLVELESKRDNYNRLSNNYTDCSSDIAQKILIMS